MRPAAALGPALAVLALAVAAALFCAAPVAAQQITPFQGRNV